ncbi:MAG TPA: SURF1 family protein [Gemmatimonadales bacterium]|nr:SURF1 family protein [Gemmatimonadales bacterium]
MSPRARGPLFFTGALIAALVFLRLGVWQWHRLEERRLHNAQVSAKRSLPVVAVDDPGQMAHLLPEDLNNRRVRVTGRYDHAADVVIRGQSEQGVPGVRILTPFRPLRGDTAILVLRGYVPSPDARQVDLTPLHEDGVRVVSGIAILEADSGVPGAPLEQDGQLSWRRVDIAALRARLPYPLADWIVLQTPDSTLPSLPRRDDPAPLDDGPNLSYALQWFSFAVIAIVAGVAVWRKGGEGER